MWFGLLSCNFSSEVTNWKQIALVINFFLLKPQFNFETQTFNVRVVVIVKTSECILAI